MWRPRFPALMYRRTRGWTRTGSRRALWTTPPRERTLLCIWGIGWPREDLNPKGQLKLVFIKFVLVLSLKKIEHLIMLFFSLGWMSVKRIWILFLNSNFLTNWSLQPDIVKSLKLLLLFSRNYILKYHRSVALQYYEFFLRFSDFWVMLPCEP